MGRNLGFWLVWVGFILYAVFLAPPQQPDTFELIKKLSTGQFTGINPLIIALFNILGILPMMYACLLFFDGRGQSVRAWIFITASFGIGAFALLPYLAMRQPNPTFLGKKNWFLRLLDARWLAVILAAGAIALAAYGIAQGDWADFAQQWQTSRFIHVMSLDFCVTGLLFPVVLGDDMARRGQQSNRWLWLVSLIPVLGPAIYLVYRSPVQEQSEPTTLPPSQRYEATS